MATSISDDEHIERCAILMMSLGEDAAAEVFKYLSAREVQRVGVAMANLKQVTRSDVDEVLESFRHEADQSGSRPQNLLREAAFYRRHAGL